MAMAEAVLQQVVDLASLMAQLQSGFSFASAVGVQLDSIAESIGLKRTDIDANNPVSDETFRQYLLAKLALWIWDGTNEGVPTVLALALSGSRQTDNQDGTVTVAPVGELPAGAGELFPVTAGIRINNGEES